MCWVVIECSVHVRDVEVVERKDGVRGGQGRGPPGVRVCREHSSLSPGLRPDHGHD